MKYVGYGLIIIVCLALQTASPGLVVFGRQHELLLLLTLLFAMLQGPGASVFGFVSGLFQDILVGRFIGLYAGTYLLMAILVGFLAKRLYKENALVRFFAIVLGTVLGQLLYLFGAASFGSSSPQSWVLISGVVGTGLLNGIVGVLLYRPFMALNERLIYLHELLKRTG